MNGKPLSLSFSVVGVALATLAVILFLRLVSGVPSTSAGGATAEAAARVHGALVLPSETAIGLIRN